MSRIAPPALAWLRALREPELALGWDLAEWQRVLRLSRRLRLLGRLAEAMVAADLLPRLPSQARPHLDAELHYSRWRSRALVWALERIAQAMGAATYPLVLLKGAAYMGQQLPIAQGRLPSDVDILVPREFVADAQQRLVAAGWAEAELDAHDRHYYHALSHEVPPMRHPLHALELDLHHNILPPVAHTRVDAALLLARLQPSRWQPWQVLHPQDQLLHSATHLFHDSETRDRLRDLVDLDGLMRHFGQDPGFWDGLPARALELGLSEPLALACHFAGRWLETPIPTDTLRQIEAAGPSALRRAWLQPLFASQLSATEPESQPPWRQGWRDGA